MSLMKKTKFKPTRDFENLMLQKGYQISVGVDEAGRGPLAGPVVAAACLLPESALIEGLVECKQLTPLRREDLFDLITTHPEIKYGLGIVTHKKIDEINILQATKLAMTEAIDNIPCEVDFLLIDGLDLPHKIPCMKIVKGDEKSLSIAAASIIAKVTRDRLMKEYHQKWPEYGFENHKGYGTKKHLLAIQEYGPCPIHRMTFAPISPK